MDRSINNISTKEDFMSFLKALRDDRRTNGREWENPQIDSYLDGIVSWVEDMDGYYHNMGMDIPTNINWSFIATLFYVGKIYE